MSLLNGIIRKPTPGAPKGIWYGGPGIGKTTAAANSNALIIDCENGAGAVAAQRTPYLETWPQIEAWLTAIEKEKHDYRIIAIDTIDWLVRRIEEHVTGADKGQMSTSLMKSHGGYGAGRDVLKNYVYRVLLPMLDRIINRGIAIVLLAHASRTDITDVDGITVEKTAPDILPICLNVFLEWSDFVCLARMDAEGKRKLITTETDRALAKNRYGMPPEIPFTWSDFAAAVTQGINQKFNKEN